MCTPEYTSGQARLFSFLPALSAPSFCFVLPQVLLATAQGGSWAGNLSYLAADAYTDTGGGARQPVGDINGAQ